MLLRPTLTTAAVLIVCCHVNALESTVDFASDVAPIFQEHCVRCHGPNNEKGDVSLDTIADLIDLQYVEPGDPDGSYLLDLITPLDDDPPEMPLDGPPLGDDEIALVRLWIEQGAAWPEDVIIEEKSKADASWWSWQPIGHDLPVLDLDQPAQLARAVEILDQQIEAKLAEDALQSNPAADRQTLIRRLTYDLIGLPPTPEDIEAFVNDKSAEAYGKLVDRLLASPHYGEHWGRHWLDVVRFGESNGFERNRVIDNLWPFRDYVIDSINDDKPFDQFIHEHLAGDVIGPDDLDIKIGSSFLVAGPYDDVNNQDVVQKAQIRANTLDEIIRASSEAFLGLTVGCARCHNHKFDPITQRDYYAMYATFAGVRHGAAPWVTRQQSREHSMKVRPLADQKKKLQKSLVQLDAKIRKRAIELLEDHEPKWIRPPIDRKRTEDRFNPVKAEWVRLVCDASDTNPNARAFNLDELEIWSAGPDSRNVALASNGSVATGEARRIEDFPNAYGAHLAIDGKFGSRFISVSPELTIELAEPTDIDRIVFSSARGEAESTNNKFKFVAEYHIDVSLDGETWKRVADSADRRPIDFPESVDPKSISKCKFAVHRLMSLVTTDADRMERGTISIEYATVNQQLAKIPALPRAWMGTRNQKDAAGPFHLFIGGSPQRKGEEVTASSLENLSEVTAPYQLPEDAPEPQRRLKLADWIVQPDHPLTSRVLANRIWHYHFGTGIVSTPSDFGYMGTLPSHPELLDWLASELITNGWRLKPMHRLIVLSQTYRQSSQHSAEAAAIDADSRLLWRHPPRRLSAEQVRDTMLSVAGKLDLSAGGPGFRLYHFMQDNVCTYQPLDEHGPETYRRAVYHQNARASVVDLMTEFDQPDCTFSTPRRSETTTPLQALTMMNHSFTLDMAASLAERLRDKAGTGASAKISRLFSLCYGRAPSQEETQECVAFVQEHGLESLCRVVLNTSELIYVR